MTQLDQITFHTWFRFQKANLNIPMLLLQCGPKCKSLFSLRMQYFLTILSTYITWFVIFKWARKTGSNKYNLSLKTTYTCVSVIPFFRILLLAAATGERIERSLDMIVSPENYKQKNQKMFLFTSKKKIVRHTFPLWNLQQIICIFDFQRLIFDFLF